MKVDAKMFTWVRTAGAGITETGRVGACDYSDLGMRPGQRLAWIEVYNDATKRTVRWERVGELRCGTIDNEWQGDVFKACAADVKRLPQLRFSKLHIFND